jgi:hypothetical protein
MDTFCLVIRRSNQDGGSTCEGYLKKYTCEGIGGLGGDNITEFNRLI